MIKFIKDFFSFFKIYPKATRITFVVPNDLATRIGDANAMFDEVTKMIIDCDPEKGFFYVGMNTDPTTIWIDYDSAKVIPEEVEAFYRHHLKIS